jgi:hypothetical protein
MKKLLYPLLALTIACSSDDSEKTSKDFTYHYYNDTKSITVSKGFIAKCGEPDSDGHQEFKIRLTESRISVGDDGTLVGYGNSMFIYFESESSAELLPGEYQILPYKAGLLLDHDFDIEGGSGESIASDVGTVTVKKSGNTYTLIFDIKMEDADDEDLPLKGTFKGNLQAVSSCAALY